MTLQVELSDSIAQQACAYAEQAHTTVDAVIGALLETLLNLPRRLTVAERAARAVQDPEVRARANAVWARVPDVPPLPGDELPET